MRSELLHEFLEYLRDVKRFSENTIRSYALDLEHFSEFLGARSSGEAVDTGEATYFRAAGTAVTTETQATTTRLLLEVDTQAIESFMDYLNAHDYSQSTKIRRLSTIRTFYKFLVNRKRLEYNPAAATKLPKKYRELPRVLDQEQIQRLLDMPNTSTLLGARDRAILEILYCTGLRISELVALDMDDIDFLSDAVHVKTAGRKERVVPIWSSGIQALQKYITLRNKRAQTDPAFSNRILFVNKNGERLSSRSVRRKMDKYLIKAGLDPAISPRTLRHSFAVNMLRSGSDIHTVRELLGHQSLSTTRAYKQVAGTSEQESHEEEGHNVSAEADTLEEADIGEEPDVAEESDTLDE
ncbi:MAG: tyrosine-type recombinase/integrase [Phycisphaerae bacterium]|nr:tyrosine-type recombinase/integrase [Phycisphaerae bacterium]